MNEQHSHRPVRTQEKTGEKRENSLKKEKEERGDEMRSD